MAQNIKRSPDPASLYQERSGKIKYERKMLGNGSSGKVFPGKYEGIKVAVKRIDRLDEEGSEVRLQGGIQHENVLKILALEQDENFRYYVFLTEANKI